MKNAIILHGICDSEEYFEMDFPSPSNAHWLPWLQQQFLRVGILCQTLEMPTPYQPVYEAWCQTFDCFQLNQASIVVGYSAGCGFFLRWLHEHAEARVAKFIMVAPFLDPNKQYDEFLNFELKPEVANRIGEWHLFHSSDDGIDMQHSQQRLCEIYSDIKLNVFENYGHFCAGDFAGEAFPELWEACRT